MIHQVSDGYVKVETHHGVTAIEFFHPQSNSLPVKLMENLTREIHSAGTDDETKVIILRSAGDRAFCAGASINDLAGINTVRQGHDFFLGFANVINSMRKCPKLIVARIHGNCVGGGVGLAATADYCIALDKVEVKLSELAIGIGPFVIGPAVERRIGTSAFSQLAIDATKWRNADWAKRKGLFAEVHPDIESLDESVSHLAHSLAHFNPEAMAELKKILWKSTDHWDELLKERAAISGRLALSSFTKNAIIHFNDKKLKS